MINKEEAKQLLVDKGIKLLEEYGFNSHLQNAINNFKQYFEIEIAYIHLDFVRAALEYKGYSMDYNSEANTITVHF